MAQVLFGAGAIGFFLGAVWHPTWQDAIEPAQVLAGVVEYPPTNPVYIYSTRTWTVLHQGIALLLSLGMTERTLTIAVSGLLGMLSLQGLGLVILAVSGDVALGILGPFFIFVTAAASGGVTYPVTLLGASISYGILAMGYVVLTLGTIGTGRYHAGAWLLGFGPAVHPTAGIQAIAIVVLAMLTAGWTRETARRAFPAFLAGAAAAAICGVAHYVSIGAPRPELAIGSFPHWDEHRQPFPLLSDRAIALYFSAAVPLLVSWRFGELLSPAARVLMRILMTSTIFAGALTATYWIVPATVPNIAAWLMPSRMLNLTVITCMAILIGISARGGSSRLTQGTFAGLIFGLLALTVLLGQADEGPIRERTAWIAMACAVPLLMRKPSARESDRPARWIAQVRPAIVGTLAAAVVVVSVLAIVQFREKAAEELRDRTTDPFLRDVASRPGMLLTAFQLHLIQGPTRRPVLLDGLALDTLLYVPQAAQETDRILRRVYGTSLAESQQQHLGVMVDEAGNRQLWETRSANEWRSLAVEFGFTDVLTYATWTLQLPRVAGDNDLTLYNVSPALGD